MVKKILAVVVCAAMLLSAVSVVSFAASKEFEDYLLMDFNDYESGNTYNSYCVFRDTCETEASANARGKSLKLFNGDVQNYINFNALASSNAVYGFSYRTSDPRLTCNVSSKGTSGQWDDSAISSFAMLRGANVTFKGGAAYSGTLGEWINLAFAFDYTNHILYGYVNGELVDTYEMNEAVINTDYININLPTYASVHSGDESVETDAANSDNWHSALFDDMFVYYPDSSTKPSFRLIGADPSVSSLTVSFARPVTLAEDAYATLNGETAAVTAIKNGGYTMGVKVDAALEGRTAYTLELHGIEDLLGNSLTPAYSFETSSAEPGFEPFSIDAAEFTIKDKALSAEEGDISVSGNANDGSFEIAQAPDSKYGDSLKITSVATAESAPYINIFFNSELSDGNTATDKNFVFDFSAYVEDVTPDKTAEFYMGINLKYLKEDGTAATANIAQIKWQQLYVGANDEFTGAFISGWYDVKAVIDLDRRLSTIFVNGKYFGERAISADAATIAYINMNVSKRTETESQVMYLDNIAVNEMPVNIVEDEVVYALLDDISDDDFDNRKIKITPQTGSGYEVTNEAEDGTTTTTKVTGSTAIISDPDAETLAEHGNVLQINAPAGLTGSTSPFFTTKSVTGGYAYTNETYVYELDVKFDNFDGTYNIGSMKIDTSDKVGTWNTTPLNITSGGVIKSGSVQVGTIGANEWHNFKVVFKPRLTADTEEGSNSGLLADVYLDGKLIAENFQSVTAPVTKIQYINQNCGSVSGDRIIYIDNVLFSAYNENEGISLRAIDLKAYNGTDAVGSAYTAGTNIFDMYVYNSTFADKAITLVAARYNADTHELLNIDFVSGEAEAHAVSKIESALEVSDIGSNEYIKVFAIDSAQGLKPCIKAVEYTPAV